MTLSLNFSSLSFAPYSILFLQSSWAADWAEVQTKTGIPLVSDVANVLAYIQPPVQLDLRQVAKRAASKYITGEPRLIPLNPPRIKGRIRINGYPAWISEMLRYAAQQGDFWMLAGNMFWWRTLHSSDAINQDSVADTLKYREAWPFNYDVTAASGNKWLSYMKATAIKIRNAELTKFSQPSRAGDAPVDSEMRFDALYEGSTSLQATAPPASIRPSIPPSFTTADPLLLLSQEVASTSDRFDTIINIHLPSLNL